MNDRVRWSRSIVIVGAPRSGTSLLQRIIRGCEGFASLVKESGFVWRRYTHPAFHDWYGETWRRGDINEHEIARIREKLARYALPASVWRKVDRFDVLRYQRVPMISATVLRPAYHALATLRSISCRLPEGTRFVDKSVQSGLWLDLVEEVFERPLYLHIVRDPFKSVESMAAGWRNPDRFFSYKVPEVLAIPGYEDQRWNFVLPPGWRAYTDRPIEVIAAFQWAALQRNILTFADEIPEQRYLRVRLEDLSNEPREVLSQICTWAGIEFDEYMEKYVRNMPTVNARDTGCQRGYDSASVQALSSYPDLVNALGYD